MKKALLVLVSLVLMLATQLAFADEEFTLHNGTKFGMNKDEVLKLESSKGFSITYESGFNFASGTGTIANQPDTEIYYNFNGDGELSSMKYSFSNVNSFDIIEKNISKKYGETEYSSDTLKELPTISSFPTVPFSGDARGKYSQRFLEIGDGQYVLIDHYVNIRKTSTGEVVQKSHCLDYTLFSDNEADIILNNSTDDL